MKKITIVIIATLALVGCGGGGGSDGSSGSVGGNSGGTTASYSAFVPLQDNPKTFQCVENAPATLSGSLYLAQYDTEAECNATTQAWIASYNHDDIPSTAEQQAGLDYLNSLRRGVGVPIFHYNSKLEQATFNHERYLDDTVDTFNINQIHYENNTTYPSIHYTGVYPTDRALHTGYTGYYAGDVVTFGYGDINATQSLKNLIPMIYHRQAMLTWNFMNEIGIGGVQTAYISKSQAHLMGAKSDRDTFIRAVSAKIMVYPYVGQTQVQTTFFNNEVPDPLPNNNNNVGNPISVTFNSYYTTSVSMTSFKLFKDNTNTEVTNVLLMDKATDPNGDFGDTDFALFPLDVLDSNTTYRVEIQYVLDGVSGFKIWTFKTR